jgi:hypothetical protein
VRRRTDRAPAGPTSPSVSPDVDGEGTATGVVWRFKIDDRTWTPVTPVANLSPTDKLLGAAYDQRRGLFYILDVEESFVPFGRSGKRVPIKVARLYRYDAGSMFKSKLLATFPYFGWHHAIHLGVNEGGDLVMVGAMRDRYSAWLFEASAEKLKFKGLATGKGRVLGAPVVGERYLELAFKDKNHDVRYLTLSPDTFKKGAACAGL